MTIKILNLYAGIGGNRKLWSGDIEVTAIEIHPDIAKIYQELFPEDNIIVTDAHQFLLEHYKEYDFIWTSPPCPTHSRIINLKMQQENYKPKFPNMQLYEEIIFLRQWFKGKWVVENVISYYKPLIKPLKLGRHYIWSNFNIPEKEFKDIKITRNESSSLSCLALKRGINPEMIKVKDMDKRQVISNMVSYEMGKYIFECSKEEINSIFDDSLNNQQNSVVGAQLVAKGSSGSIPVSADKVEPDVETQVEDNNHKKQSGSSNSICANCGRTLEKHIKISNKRRGGIEENFYCYTIEEGKDNGMMLMQKFVQKKETKGKRLKDNE